MPFVTEEFLTGYLGENSKNNLWNWDKMHKRTI